MLHDKQGSICMYVYIYIYISLEVTNQIKSSQGFCWVQIRRQVTFLLLPNSIPKA